MHEILKKEIKEHLIVKYQPEVIILHGSRASDNYKPHSDWDLFLFIKSDTQSRKLSREIYTKKKKVLEMF